MNSITLPLCSCFCCLEVNKKFSDKVYICVTRFLGLVLTDKFIGSIILVPLSQNSDIVSKLKFYPKTEATTLKSDSIFPFSDIAVLNVLLVSLAQHYSYTIIMLCHKQCKKSLPAVLCKTTINTRVTVQKKCCAAASDKLISAMYLTNPALPVLLKE